MQLLQFIDTLRNDPQTSESTRESFSLVYNTLRQYLDTDIDILQTAANGWSDAYYDYLLNQYKSRNGRLSAKTASQRWTQFRGIIRHAVKRNIYPDIEIDPKAIVNRDNNTTRRPKRDSIADEIAKLDDLLKRKPDKWLQRYVSCLRLGGLDISQYMSLVATPVDADCSTVTLPQFAVDITVNNVLLCNRAAENANSTDKGTGQQAVKGETIITSLMRQHGLRLLSAGDIFSDWLCLIKERGTPDEVIRDIITLRYSQDKHPSALQTDTIRSLIVQSASSVDATNSLRWYALMTIGRTPYQVMDDFDRTIRHSVALKRGEREVHPGEEPLLRIPDGFNVSDRLIPYDRSRDGGNTQLTKTASVLSNIMFVRTSDDDIRQFASLISNAYVYSTVIDGRRTYISIPPIQIYRMRRMLNYLADYTDNLDESNLGIEIPDDLQPGERVQICLPGFEKYDVVVDCEETERDRRRMGRKTAGNIGANVKNYYLLFRCDNNLELRLPFPRDLLRRI